MNDNDKLDQLGRLAYSVTEVAQVLGLGKTTVYNLMDSGKLPFCKIGSRRRVRTVDLEALIALQTSEAA